MVCGKEASTRVSFSFLPKEGQNEIVWIIGGGGGGQVHICVQSMQQTWEVWGHAPILDLLLDNLVESGTVFAPPPEGNHEYNEIISTSANQIVRQNSGGGTRILTRPLFPLGVLKGGLSTRLRQVLKLWQKFSKLAGKK